MDVLRIVLIVLAITGVWALVELALTFRKINATVDTLTKEVTEIADSANSTIERCGPILNKVDDMVADLNPAVQKIGPLVDKATTAVDVVTVDLASVNDILVDVSSVTDTASNVTSTVSRAANSAVSGVSGVVGKFTGGGKKRRSKRFAAAPREASHMAAPEPIEEEPVASESYFTYSSKE